MIEPYSRAAAAVSWFASYASPRPMRARMSVGWSSDQVVASAKALATSRLLIAAVTFARLPWSASMRGPKRFPSWSTMAGSWRAGSATCTADVDGALVGADVAGVDEVVVVVVVD